MGKPVKGSDQNKAWNRMPKARQVNVRPVRKRFLIVSEGTKTEPLYFKALEIAAYEGLKGDAGQTFHEQMATHANQATAIARAQKLYADWSDAAGAGTPPSRQKPCTTVYQLVEKLLACRQVGSREAAKNTKGERA